MQGTCRSKDHRCSGEKADQLKRSTKANKTNKKVAKAKTEGKVVKNKFKGIRIRKGVRIKVSSCPSAALCMCWLRAIRCKFLLQGMITFNIIVNSMLPEYRTQGAKVEFVCAKLLVLSQGIKVTDADSKKKAIKLLKAEQAMREMEIDSDASESGSDVEMK